MSFLAHFHRLCTLLAAACIVLFSNATQAAAQQPVDLELLLAVDSSSSVNDREFDLQMRGIAEAFRHPGVHGALQAAGGEGIAVALMQWSNSRHQTLSVGWTLVRDPETAEAFADEVERTARFVVGGGTAIGTALEYGASLFPRNAFDGRRKVIDVSGDGRANQGRFPSRSRADVIAQGVTINGLAILNEDGFLDRYYLQYVIGGTGAFVITADDYDAFAIAMIRKLIQEISGVPLSQAPDAGEEGEAGLAFARWNQ